MQTNKDLQDAWDMFSPQIGMFGFWELLTVGSPTFHSYGLNPRGYFKAKDEGPRVLTPRQQHVRAQRHLARYLA